MAEIKGLQGLRPAAERAGRVSSPPYDVIREGSPLESLLKSNPDSLYHIILGKDPAAVLEKFIGNQVLQEDLEPCYYIYEQTWSAGNRTGFLAAVEVDDYSRQNIIRHEKTFDDKVHGRIQLARKTGYTFGPIFLLTKSSIQSILEEVKGRYSPVYEFTTDLNGHSDLHGIRNRIYRLPESSEEGRALKDAVYQNSLYIADGHHRYHAALKNGQTHTLAYIVQNAKI